MDEFVYSSEKNEESTGADTWSQAYCSGEEDVQLVRDSLLAVIFTFDPMMPHDNLGSPQVADLKNHLKQQVDSILKFVDRLDEDGWDGQTVAVAKALSRENSVREHTVERTEVIDHVKDLFTDYGIEVVDMLDEGVKDGEKQGVERLRELLETLVALSGVPVEDEENDVNPDDPIQTAIEKIMTEGGIQPFDSSEVDKTLKESGFTFPLLDKSHGPRAETDMDVGDMEELVKKIRLARSSKSSMPASDFQSLMNEIAHDLSKFI